MSSSKSSCEWNSSLDCFDNFRDNVFFVPVYRKEALRGTVCSVREVVRESSNSPRFISQLVLFANGFQLCCYHNLSLCAQINNKRKKVWISRLDKFWSNFRIPRNSFTCHWIRIASIVLCLDLQSLPTHVSEADQSCGVFWSLA